MDFSPDGRYFAIVGTGSSRARAVWVGTLRRGGPVRDRHRATRPTWINYTGGDTLHSIAVTDTAVYVQGHSAGWTTRRGRTTPAPARVSARNRRDRPYHRHGAGLEPDQGPRVGGKDLLLTRAGLWVASDTTTIGGETHERLAFMPTS